MSIPLVSGLFVISVQVSLSYLVVFGFPIYGLVDSRRVIQCVGLSSRRLECSWILSLAFLRCVNSARALHVYRMTCGFHRNFYCVGNSTFSANSSLIDGAWFWFYLCSRFFFSLIVCIVFYPLMHVSVTSQNLSLLSFSDYFCPWIIRHTHVTFCDSVSSRITISFCCGVFASLLSATWRLLCSDFTIDFLRVLGLLVFRCSTTHWLRNCIFVCFVFQPHLICVGFLSNTWLACFLVLCLLSIQGYNHV